MFVCRSNVPIERFRGVQHGRARHRPPQHHHPCHLGHKSRAQWLHTSSDNHCNGPMSPAGNATSHPHTAITPMAQDRPPQHYHQCRTTCPAPLRHATWRPNPCMVHPHLVHGTLHHPKHLPSRPPKPTHATPTAPCKQPPTPAARPPAGPPNDTQPTPAPHARWAHAGRFVYHIFYYLYC
jgi:hypothetical protein